MSSRKLLLSFLVFSLFPLLSSEGDRRNDKLNLYKLPSEIILPADITGLAGLDDKTKIETIGTLLQKYYIQFIDHKRIWQDKADGPEYNIRMDYNATRLLSAQKRDTMSQTGLLRDSPILFNLYLTLGDLYSAANETDKALSHYLAALSYRELGSTEDLYVSSSRLKEIYDPSETNQAMTFNNLKKEREKTLLELKKAKDHNFQLDALLSNGKMNSTEYTTNKNETTQSIRNLTEKQQSLEIELDKSRKESYQPWAEAKQNMDASFLFKLANIVRKVEDTSKDRLKLTLKKNSLLYDYSKNINFPGYLGFLEMAYRIKPDHIDVITAIARELESIGKKEESIDYYKKLISLKDASGSKDTVLQEACFHTARLYSAAKKYSLAAKFYERSLALGTETKPDLFYEIATFHENHTGNLDRAFFLYSAWLDETNKIPTTLTLEHKKLIAHVALASYWRYKKKTVSEEKELLQAYKIFAEIKKQKELASKSSEEIKKELIAIKGNLLQKSDIEKLALYRQTEKKLEEARRENDRIGSVFSVLPKVELLFRMAEIAEKKKELDMAISYLTTVIEIGNENDIRLALKHVTRLQKRKETGIQFLE